MVQKIRNKGISTQLISTQLKEIEESSSKRIDELIGLLIRHGVIIMHKFKSCTLRRRANKTPS